MVAVASHVIAFLFFGNEIIAERVSLEIYGCDSLRSFELFQFDYFLVFGRTLYNICFLMLSVIMLASKRSMIMHYMTALNDSQLSV